MKSQVEAAIRNNDWNTLKTIFCKTPKLGNEYTEDGIWYSHYAAMLGSYDALRCLVEYSFASYNVPDEEGNNLLHYAVRSGNLELIKYVTEKVGFSPLSSNLERITPIDLAAELENKEILHYFEAIVGCKYNEMYRNPVKCGMSPDPSIVRVGEDYYMVNSTFAYFPCIPVSHSRDLVHWNTIGYAITNPDYSPLEDIDSGCGFWAPDISYHNGRFYIAVTLRCNDGGETLRKQMIVSSDKPEGPYSKPIYIEEEGIDPSLFTDVDGKRYMLLNRGARIMELNEDATAMTGEPRLLYYGDNKRAPEGPHLLYKDGYYYLFLAEGGTGLLHKITVQRSTSLFGTYEPCPYNPIMTQLDENHPLQKCGHGKPVSTPDGRWYMVYLCSRPLDNKHSVLGRETALDPITWTADGWPLVNSLNGPSILQKAPLPMDDHDYDSLIGNIAFNNINWLSLRTRKYDYTATAEELLLPGSDAPLYEKNTKGIFLLRQMRFHYNFSCDIQIPSEMQPGQTFGLICYYDEYSYLYFGVMQEGEHKILCVEEHTDDRRENVRLWQSAPIADDELRLITNCNKLNRSFSYKKPGGDEAVFCYEKKDALYLADEGSQFAKRFTGSAIGVYAYSGDTSKPLVGHFKNFEIHK